VQKQADLKLMVIDILESTDDEKKVCVYEIYRDAAAFKLSREQSLHQAMARRIGRPRGKRCRPHGHAARIDEGQAWR
jgi:hypothetical protein